MYNSAGPVLSDVELLLDSSHQREVKEELQLSSAPAPCLPFYLRLNRFHHVFKGCSSGPEGWRRRRKPVYRRCCRSSINRLTASQQANCCECR